VEFFIAARTANGCDTIWTSVGTDGVSHLPVGESRIVHDDWLPAAGFYCLIAKLSAPDLDEPNADTVALDNNKAQIEVEVIPSGF
jgi:hypothetical protein